MQAPKPSLTPVLALLLGVTSIAQDQAPQPLVHFHHVHLNALNPDLAMGWYTRHFDAERAKLRGRGRVVGG